MHDVDIFGVDNLEGNKVIVDVREKIVEKEVSTADLITTAGEVVTAASVEDTKPKVISTGATTVTTAITTPRAKRIVFHEQVQTHIPTISSSKDKGKAKIIEPEQPLKKDQITLDEEVARKLKAEMKLK
nr:hypothetical protein [Tanacetum cinerariifolium]